MPLALANTPTCTCELCGGLSSIVTFEEFDHDWTPIQVTAAMCLDCGHETEHETA